LIIFGGIGSKDKNENQIIGIKLNSKETRLMVKDHRYVRDNPRPRSMRGKRSEAAHETDSEKDIKEQPSQESNSVYEDRKQIIVNKNSPAPKRGSDLKSIISRFERTFDRENP
jgi:hypothetical protein